jgi:hypothetical protein
MISRNIKYHYLKPISGVAAFVNKKVNLLIYENDIKIGCSI